MIGFPRSLIGLYKCALVAISLVAIMVGPVRPQDANQTLDTAQIESLVAPIALYPDNLVSQILMASTYPLEVVEAARWSQENPGVTEAALQDAMQNQKWDPSVKALTAVPQVLRMMNDRLQWTQQLGDAFLAQQSAVLNAVQVLRARADKAGNLQTTSQQTVTRTENPAYVSANSGLPPIVYTIVPAEPEVIFVPIYDPVIVFGPWPYPWYPPFYWYPPGFVPSNVLAFAAGIFVGAAIWADVNWWDRRVLINVDRYNRFNRTRITSNTWRHDSTHRRGVPYSDRRIANLFDKRRPAAKAGMGGMAPCVRGEWQECAAWHPCAAWAWPPVCAERLEWRVYHARENPCLDSATDFIRGRGVHFIRARGTHFVRGRGTRFARSRGTRFARTFEAVFARTFDGADVANRRSVWSAIS